MPSTKASSKTSGRRRSAKQAGLQGVPVAKRSRKDVRGNDILVRPQSANQSHPWPTRALTAFAMPLEEYGWGALLEHVLISRGWKILRPCTVFKSNIDGQDPDIHILIKEFTSVLQGRKSRAYRLGPNQSLVCKRAATLPSHALMLMAHTVVKQEDFVRLFVANRRKFSQRGRQYKFAALPGAEAALWKCNLSEAFRNEDFYPTAYVLPKEAHLLRKEITNGKKSYWIAKPNDLFGGKGISVWSQNDPGFLKLVRDSKGKKRSIVQRYLDDPMLVGSFKFHMRVHLIVTSLSPLKAYIHEGGQVLCGTRPYTLSKKTLNRHFDRAVHLTNQCFNANPQNKANYIRSKPTIGKGQQITIPELERYLKKHHRGFDRQDLWKQIVHIGKRVAQHLARFRSIRKYKGKMDPGQHFEIYGLDLMLDRSCKVWLCEANNSPGMSYPDRMLLGVPNPDYAKEVAMCKAVFHDTMTLLGLDAGKQQRKGSLSHWYEVDFSQ